MEIYKVKHYEASLPIKKKKKKKSEITTLVNLSFNLRKDTKFHSYKVKTVHYGTETLS